MSVAELYNTDPSSTKNISITSMACSGNASVSGTLTATTLNALSLTSPAQIVATATTNQLKLGASAHNTVINSVAPAAASQTLNIPDSGLSSDSFALLGLASQTFSGLETFSNAGGVLITNPTNQLTLGASSHTAIVNAVAPAAASQTYSINDPKANASFLMAQSISTSAVLSLSVGQSGALISASAASGAYSITLPAVAGAAGCRYKIVLNTAGAHNVTVTSGAANILCTIVNNNAGTPTFVAPTAKTNIIFASSTAIAGDYMEFWCDGTNYFGYASGSATSAITSS